jgi:hypothetical protein
MPTFNTTDPKPGYVYDSAIDTWFPLVGIAPASEVDRWTKTVAGGETSLSGEDDNSVSLSYTAGTEQVYLNGVLLARGSDYTATNGTTITGLTALAASDIAEVITFNPSNILTTDAVIATDFEAKGDLISASAASTPVRLPVGTTGQVLKANSATTSGLEWGSVDADIEGVTAGTGISGGGTSGTVTITNSMATAIDAKGDLVAGTGADAFSRLAVGTNGQVLTAASGETTGLSWATPAAGGMTLLSTTTLSGTSTTISSISGAYNHLFVVISGVVQTVTTYNLLIQPNGSATIVDQSGTGFSGSSSLTGFINSPISHADGILANNSINAFQLEIYNYASTSDNKPIRYSGVFRTTSGTPNYAVNYGGGIRTTSAITSLVFTSQTGNPFTAGTVLLYGVK